MKGDNPSRRRRAIEKTLDGAINALEGEKAGLVPDPEPPLPAITEAEDSLRRSLLHRARRLADRS